ncbi:MAG: T9SS type A sorting domain-containing protein [Bacteroidota bacterium]|jgi:predicted CXXCH cytochrome family protein
MKRFLHNAIVLVVLLSVLTGLALAQTQTGKVKVVGIPDRFKSANKNQVSPGLKTVGQGQRVVLTPYVWSTTGTKQADTIVPVISATWTLTNPFGATKPIQDTAAGLNGTYVYFVPDTVGDWTASYSATTKLGAVSGTSKITVAKYVGEGISLASNQGVPNGCACHLVDPTKFSDWSKTNHAVAIKIRGNDPAGHFSFACFSCHSIGTDAGVAVNNNGFFDAAKVEGLTTFPKNGPGAYDTLVAKYPKSMALTGIQCENCHGPAGQHAGGIPVPGNNKLDESWSTEVCAPCHFSSDRHGIGYAYTGSRHYTSSSNGSTRLNNFNRLLCAHCHTGQGYVYETIQGNLQTVPATGEVEYVGGTAMTCVTCHDPHNGSNEMQLRAKTVGDACLGCHVVRLSTGGSLHTSHQGSMLLGVNTTPFSQDALNAYSAVPSGTPQQVVAAVGAWGGWELPGYVYENSSHSDIKERCVACHMASSPSFLAASASNFVQADTMITKLGGHTFKVAYDNIVGKDTTTILNPTGCMECHGTVSMDFVESTQTKTRGLLANLFKALPKRDSAGTTISTMTDTVAFQAWTKAPASAKRKLTTIDKAAIFNYNFVNSDGSFGVHNFNYAKGLLNSSLEQVTLGAGASSIASIKDVPLDNGKKVQVVWNAFPSEQYSYNQVVNYGVFRKDPTLPSLNSIKKVGSFTELMQTTKVGGSAIMAGNVWTYVGSVPASGLPQYSYIASTIFDSTKTSGQRWTTFYIAGYTAASTVAYSSQPDSGYSVDNISPASPTGLNASFTNNTVNLQWRANDESDVVAYAIYRGTTPNFNPAGTAPLAIVRTPLYQDAVSQSGVAYYYKISAIDQAGNESGYTAVSVLTSVETGSGVPTEFALNQNYPNPFNPTTEIAFSVPKQTAVKIVIYGLSGEVVATVVNQTMSAGNYRITWNGRTDDGRSVASGVYFYHLQAEGFTATKKMTLLK